METINESGCIPGALTEGIVVFALVMAILGFQILLESARQIMHCALHRQCLFGGLRIDLYEPIKNLYVGENFVGDVPLTTKYLQGSQLVFLQYLWQILRNWKSEIVAPPFPMIEPASTFDASKSLIFPLPLVAAAHHQFLAGSRPDLTGNTRFPNGSG